MSKLLIRLNNDWFWENGKAGLKGSKEVGLWMPESAQEGMQSPVMIRSICDHKNERLLGRELDHYNTRDKET